MPLIKTETGYRIVPGSSVGGGARTRTSPAAQRERQELIRVAQKAGFTEEARRLQEPPKLSLLQRLGRGLTAFETSDAIYAGLYENKPVLKEYAKNALQSLGTMVTGRELAKEPKKTFKDILKMEGMRDRPGKLDPIDIAGLAGDILTDPTTYIGGFIGKGALKGVSTIMKGAEKLPMVGTSLKTARAATEGLFKPFAKIERLGESGKSYLDGYLKFVRGTRAQMDDFLGVVAERAKGAKAIAGKEAGKIVAEAVERGEKTGVGLVDDIVDELVGLQEKGKIAEKERGILTRELPNYLHHMITREARDFFNKGGDVSGFVKPVRVKLGAAKPRKLEGTITQINESFKAKHGFNLFEEDAFRAFGKRGVDSIKAVKTYDFLKQTAESFGRKTEGDFVENGIRWVESTAPQLKGYRLPEPIVKHLDEVNKVLTNDESTNAFLRVFDKVQNFWKGSVTGWFPAFHTRNALGGVFNNFIAGLHDPTVYITAENILKGGAGEITTAAGKKLTFEEIRNLAKENGILGQMGFFDVVKTLEEKIGPSATQRLASAPQKVMGAIENRLRLPLFIDGLKKGYTVEQATKRVIKFHFDYAPEGLTAFERNVMRRIIPFYTWTRNNIPLQLEQVIMKPGKYAAVFKAQRAAGIQPSTKEEEVLPIWLREQFTFKGESGYWAGLGLPIEEATQKLARPLRGVGISLSPLIKTPIERLTGYNIFKERRIDEDRYAKHYKNLPKPILNWLEFRTQKTKAGTKYYTVNPHKKYWLELIGARGWTTALRIANSQEDKKNIFSLIIPMRIYNYSMDDLQRWAENDKVEALEKALLDAGIIRKFERTFVPKK